MENVSAYLFATLRHATARIGERRARESRQSLEAFAPNSSAGSASSTNNEDDCDRSAWLRETVGRLSDEQREVIALKIDGGLTFAEIAATLGISHNTAASRYRYALEKLRAAALTEPNDP